MKTKTSGSTKQNKHVSKLIWKYCILALLFLAGTGIIEAQDGDSQPPDRSTEVQAKVTGLEYICVHVLELEKTLKLYREILGFKLDDAEVYHGPGLEGMLAMKLSANDLKLTLSLTAPEYLQTVGPVGNTNHNHFMLRVNDIGSIGDQLKEEGYELENENYHQDKYTFFTGPNGEIIGLAGW